MMGGKRGGLMRSPPNANRSASDSNINLMDQTAGETSETTNVRNSKRRRNSGEELKDDFNLLKTELKEMISELMLSQTERLNTMEGHIKEIITSNQIIRSTNLEIEKAMNYMSDQLAAFEKKISCFDTERLQLRKDIELLEDKVDYLESVSLKTSLELRNVPKRTNESKADLYGTIETLLVHLKQDFSLKTDIRDVRRLPSKKESKISPIQLEVSNTLMKENIIEAVRKFNKDRPKKDKLNASHLGFNDPETPIYISEELSAKMRRLFYLARGVAKSENYKFCWSSNGRIYLRKDTSEPYILIKSEAQLEKLKTDGKKAL